MKNLRGNVKFKKTFFLFLGVENDDEDYLNGEGSGYESPDSYKTDITETVSTTISPKTVDGEKTSKK